MKIECSAGEGGMGLGLLLSPLLKAIWPSLLFQ
jgi:hypothetical protein